MLLGYKNPFCYIYKKTVSTIHLINYFEDNKESLTTRLRLYFRELTLEVDRFITNSFLESLYSRDYWSNRLLHFQFVNFPNTYKISVLYVPLYFTLHRDRLITSIVVKIILSHVDFISCNFYVTGNKHMSNIKDPKEKFCV